MNIRPPFRFLSSIDLNNQDLDLDNWLDIISTSNPILCRRKSEIWVSTIFPDVEHLRKRAQHLFASIVKSLPIFNVERNLSNSTRLGKITMKSRRNAPLARIEDAPASGAFSDGSLARCPSHPCRALVHVSGCCSKLSRIQLFFVWSEFG